MQLRDVIETFGRDSLSCVTRTTSVSGALDRLVVQTSGIAGCGSALLKSALVEPLRGECAKDMTAESRKGVVLITSLCFEELRTQSGAAGTSGMRRRISGSTESEVRRKTRSVLAARRRSTGHMTIRT